MPVGPAGPWGLHSLCPHPRGRRLAAPQGVACGCGAGIGQGSSLPGAGRAFARRASGPSSPGHQGCLGPTAVRMVGGGFCLCRRGSPHRLVAPGGVLGRHCVPFALVAPGPVATVVAGVMGLVPGSLGTQRWSRRCVFAWLHGRGGPRVGATASVARSFRPAYRSPYAP